MAGEYRSISDGIGLVSTIIGSERRDRLARLSATRRARRMLEPPALLLVRDGRILHRNLRREYITIDELRAKLREHGMEDVAEAKHRSPESDGEISVLTDRRRVQAATTARRAASGV